MRLSIRGKGKHGFLVQHNAVTWFFRSVDRLQARAVCAAYHSALIVLQFQDQLWLTLHAWLATLLLRPQHLVLHESLDQLQVARSNHFLMF